LLPSRARTIQAPFVADDDEVVPAHLHDLHEALPDAQLAIVPGTTCATG
jgi:hypothetical protein